MVDRDRERLVEEIARARARVADLERERDAELLRIAEFEAEIVALDAIPTTTANEIPVDPGFPTEPAAPRRSLQKKVEIFRGLFRGCEDVYPTRFESARTGKPGYGPECANKGPRMGKSTDHDFSRGLMT